MDIDKLFNDDAFKNIDDGLRDSFKKLAMDIKGKDFNQTLDLIIKFSENMPKGKAISDSEKNIMISAILNSLDKDERSRFKAILDMFG